MTAQLTTPAHLRPSQHTAAHVIAVPALAGWAPDGRQPGSGRLRGAAGTGGPAALANGRPVANERQELEQTSLTVIDRFRMPAREG